MTNRKLESWVIPPEADAELVACLEEVLETYEKPYAAACPVLCMDEQPVQLTKEVRQPIPATKKHPKRVDYEHKRAGTASIFMFCKPLAGWREATARNTKTKYDWAVAVAALFELRAWSTDVNKRQRGVDWQMKIADARGKLKSLYPKIRT